MADKVSYFSRFFVKFGEILAAAVATAISGYLVAHLNGYLPKQLSGFFPSQVAAPASVQIAPGNAGASKVVPASLPAQPALVPSSSVDTAEHHVAPPQDAATAGQPAKKTAKATSPHKHGKGETAKTETTATTAATEPKLRESEDEESVEAQVRAALANVDANRPASTELPPRRGDSPATTAVPPRPLELAPLTPSVAPQPAEASLQSAPIQSIPAQTAPVPSAPAQPATIQSAPIQAAPIQAPPLQQADPLTTVEIKSRPIATVDTPAPEQPPPPAEERGVLSVLKHMLPDFRRPAAPPDEAPRPPAPVGE